MLGREVAVGTCGVAGEYTHIYLLKKNILGSPNDAFSASFGLQVCFFFFKYSYIYSLATSQVSTATSRPNIPTRVQVICTRFLFFLCLVFFSYYLLCLYYDFDVYIYRYIYYVHNICNNIYK